MSRRQWFFKTCGPDSALVFRRRTVYSSLHFPHDPRIISILYTMCSLICDEHIDTQYSRFLYGRQDTKSLKERYPLSYSISSRWLHEPVASFPFYFQLSVSKLFEAGWRSSYALWTKSFYQAIEDNLSVFLRTRQTSQMFAFRRQTAYSSF